jgi:hypothetical protein
MKIGDLVRPVNRNLSQGVPLVEKDWKGIIIDWEGTEPVVFWNERFSAEVEYKEQIEVICESG